MNFEALWDPWASVEFIYWLQVTISEELPVSDIISYGLSGEN